MTFHIKSPKETEQEVKAIADATAMLDCDDVSISDMFDRVKGIINAHFKNENTRLNAYLFLAMKQKLGVIEKTYNLIDKIFKELMKDERLDINMISTPGLLDKLTILMETFLKAVTSLTDKNEVINVQLTNNITNSTTNGTINFSGETKDKMQALIMQMMNNEAMKRRAEITAKEDDELTEVIKRNNSPEIIKKEKELRRLELENDRVEDDEDYSEEDEVIEVKKVKKEVKNGKTTKRKK